MQNSHDIEEIDKLLRSNDLPYTDLTSSEVEFITHQVDGHLIGCIGIENYGEHGLMRSLAVNNSHKSKGVGKRLIQDLIAASRMKGMKRIHLLTTTAQDYFPRFGFKLGERSKAPAAILNTKEFSELCPSNSVYVVLDL